MVIQIDELASRGQRHRGILRVQRDALRERSLLLVEEPRCIRYVHIIRSLAQERHYARLSFPQDFAHASRVSPRAYLLRIRRGLNICVWGGAGGGGEGHRIRKACGGILKERDIPASYRSAISLVKKKESKTIISLLFIRPVYPRSSALNAYYLEKNM